MDNFDSFTPSLSVHVIFFIMVFLTIYVWFEFQRETESFTKSFHYKKQSTALLQ